MSKTCPTCGASRDDAFPLKLPEGYPDRGQPYRCPVCNGCGTVPPDFYDCIGYGSSVARVTCRACGGAGIVWGECS